MACWGEWDSIGKALSKKGGKRGVVTFSGRLLGFAGNGKREINEIKMRKSRVLKRQGKVITRVSCSGGIFSYGGGKDNVKQRRFGKGARPRTESPLKKGSFLGETKRKVKKKRVGGQGKGLQEKKLTKKVWRGGMILFGKNRKRRVGKNYLSQGNRGRKRGKQEKKDNMTGGGELRSPFFKGESDLRTVSREPHPGSGTKEGAGSSVKIHKSQQGGG